MAKNDGKDIYRKKAYTPPKKTHKLSKASIDLKKDLLEWELKHNPNDAFAQKMVDLADKGANIAKIARALATIPSEWMKKTGTYDMTMDLSKKKYFNKVERPVRNAFTLLTERLDPVFPECAQGQRINQAIINMQSELKKYKWIIDEYFNLRLYELCFEELEKSYNYDIRGVNTNGDVKNDDGFEKNINLAAIRQLMSPDKLRAMLRKKLKPAKQSSHKLWNNAKLLIGNELERIGYSKKQSQIKTAELLNLYYPDHYNDTDPDLIKSALSYHKKKAKR